MFLILFLVWIAALIYLQVRDMHSDNSDNKEADDQTQTSDSSKHENFDRLVRLYIFVFGVVIVFKVFFFLILFFNSIHIVTVQN